MEQQRIGSSSKPLEGAGFDPAFIPGLSSPLKADEPADAKPAEEAEEAAETDEVDEVGEAPAAEAEEGAPAAEAEEGAPAAEPEEEAPAEEDASEGPVFEASDRRARIVADAKGVRLTLDEEQCEFRWDEIGAVETEVPRFGKRFTVTVHTPDRRWYPIEIEATARARFKEWEASLDEVLDAYFEEDAQDADQGREEPRA